MGERGVQYCSLRWFGFSSDDIPEKLHSCLNFVSSGGLWDWFVTNKEPMSRDGRLPFGLCVVEPSRESGWTVTRFMSLAIERFCFRWSMGSQQRNAHQLANLLQNRVLRGGLGIYVERCLFDALGEGVKLTIFGANGFGSPEVYFKELRIIPESELELEEDILYKIDSGNFPS